MKAAVTTGYDPPVVVRVVEGLDRATRTDRELGRLAERAGLDSRDLEAALVRLAIGHRRGTRCAGGEACTALTDRHAPSERSR